jgi:hypothetical protein
MNIGEFRPSKVLYEYISVDGLNLNEGVVKSIAGIFYSMILALITLVSSYVLGVFFDNGMIFSRSGSLLVCIAIYFGVIRYSFSLKGVYEDSTIFSDVLADSMEEVDEQDRDHLKRIVGDVYSEPVGEVVEGHLEELMGRVTLYVESRIAIMGTLVWGFGDLLVF